MGKRAEPAAANCARVERGCSLGSEQKARPDPVFTFIHLGGYGVLEFMSENIFPVLQGSFFGWLKTTEAWQRLVVRKHRAKFILYVIFTAGVLIWAQLVISSNEPVLKLEQLNKQAGVLTGAGFSGKNRNRWVSLRLLDGQTVTYNVVSPGKIDLLKELVGQPVVVWSQKRFSFLPPYGEDLLEMQQQEKRLLNYDYAGRLKRRHLGFIWYILPGLMMVLSLVTLWRINRHAVQSNSTCEEKA